MVINFLSTIQQVILGGGRQAFGVPAKKVDPNTCTRNDSRDLTKEWLSIKKSEGQKARYVSTARELALVDPESTDFLLGESDCLVFIMHAGGYGNSFTAKLESVGMKE